MMAFKKHAFKVLLFGLSQLLKITAWKYPAFKDRLKEKNFTAQLMIKNSSLGRYFTFKEGKIVSKQGIHSSPDVIMFWETAEVAVKLLTSPMDFQARIDAMKNFQLAMTGPDELTHWFTETLSLMLSANIIYSQNYGIDVGNGVKRYVNNTNGGPVFVYVENGKILRITPIEFDDGDAEPWTIEARGKKFTPPHKTTLSPHTLSMKSIIYSPDRLLYPMKRADFDPGGARNHENRGISGYERISWNEALDIVAGEIKRV
ncbi:MAG: pyrogallol hydroxytransferase large subunit, partial [Deltaproteobacteria bacterium]|nr:pyrogallol hydroxytransferase large subunit [Deltaproteobacteria bacterium]